MGIWFEAIILHNFNFSVRLRRIAANVILKEKSNAFPLQTATAADPQTANTALVIRNTRVVSLPTALITFTCWFSTLIVQWRQFLAIECTSAVSYSAVYFFKAYYIAL